MFVMASVTVLLLEALVVVLLLVGALLWLFFLLRQPRPATAARTLLPVLGGGSRVPENAHSRQSGE
jgi:uncharacterized membrane protein YqiK